MARREAPRTLWCAHKHWPRRPARRLPRLARAEECGRTRRPEQTTRALTCTRKTSMNIGTLHAAIT